jgi:hypothetical protein
VEKIDYRRQERRLLGRDTVAVTSASKLRNSATLVTDDLLLCSCNYSARLSYPQSTDLHAGNWLTHCVTCKIGATTEWQWPNLARYEGIISWGLARGGCNSSRGNGTLAIRYSTSSTLCTRYSQDRTIYFIFAQRQYRVAQRWNEIRAGSSPCPTIRPILTCKLIGSYLFHVL